MAKDPHTGQRAPLKIVRLNPPTPAKLREALNAGQNRPVYPMVHIIGYHPQDGFLHMEQENGREDLVPPKQLAAAFSGSGVQIILLNICSGLEFAQALINEGVSALSPSLVSVALASRASPLRQHCGTLGGSKVSFI